MKTKTYDYQVLITGIFLLMGLHATASAQTVWADGPGLESEVGIELMIPSFDDLFGTEFPSSALLLHVRAPIGRAISLNGELPVSHLSADGGTSETDIGNIYLGLRFHGVSPGLDFDIGGRIPTAPSDGSGLVTGMLLENYSLGTYMPKTVSLNSSANYFWQGESGLIIKTGGGPDVLIPTGDLSGDAELFVNYYGQILYGSDSFSIGGGMTGLLIVTESNLSFGDRTIHDLGILGSYHFDSTSLGGYLRVPLDDDINDYLNFVFGLNLSITL